MALNKALLKAEMKNILFAIYGNGNGDLASVNDIEDYGETQLSETEDIAKATYPDKANESNVAYPIKGYIKMAFDTTSLGNNRIEKQMKFTYKWFVDYDATGVPTDTTKNYGTYEWDQTDSVTKALIEQAVLNGWSRS